jgi:hypothetical protein
MSANPVPSLTNMKHVRVTIALTTVFMRISVEIVGPGNLVDLVLAGVRAAAARWPAVVTVAEH